MRERKSTLSTAYEMSSTSIREDILEGDTGSSAAAARFAAMIGEGRNQEIDEQKRTLDTQSARE